MPSDARRRTSPPFGDSPNSRNEPEASATNEAVLHHEAVGSRETTVYAIRFRPRQTRKQFHSLPQKGKGRVRYQMYEELKGFKKGDIVLVKEK